MLIKRIGYRLIPAKFLKLDSGNYHESDFQKKSLTFLHAFYFYNIQRLRIKSFRPSKLRQTFYNLYFCLCELEKRRALTAYHAQHVVTLLYRVMQGTQRYAPVEMIILYFAISPFLEREHTTKHLWVRKPIFFPAGVHPPMEMAVRQFVVRCIQEGIKPALLFLAQQIIDQEGLAYEWNMPHHIANLLLKHSAFPEFSPSDFAQITNNVERKIETLQLYQINSVTNALGFMIAATKQHLSVVYYYLLVPVLKKLYAVQRPEDAENIGWAAFQVYGLKCDTQEEFSKFACATSLDAEVAGLRLRNPAYIRPSTRDRQRIGFVMRGGGFVQDGFQHVHAICEYFQNSPDSRFEAFLFLTHNYQKSVIEAFQQIGCPIHTYENSSDQSKNNPYEWLRSEMAALDIDVAVWTGSPGNMAYTFGLGIASQQIIFSQHYRPDYQLESIDGRITFGSPMWQSAVFGNMRWNTIPQCVRNFGATDFDQQHNNNIVNALTALKASGRKIISVFARSEKFANPEFLHCIGQILKQTKHVDFAWTGYWHDTTVQNFFEREGLADRAHYIGWIDIRSIAGLTELVLDTFPAATGLTALAALSLGTPVLSLSLMSSILGRDIPPFYQDGQDDHETDSLSVMLKNKILAHWPTLVDLPLLCTTKAQYIERAVELLSNDIAYKNAKEAGKFLWKNIYSNSTLMGARMEAFIADNKAKMMPKLKLEAL